MRDSVAPVTVVIPCLNMESTLAEAIESVLTQTARPTEVLVMDDGSTDRSTDIARSFGHPVRVLPNREGCTGGARGGGTSQAEGTFITFCDADDTIHPTKIEKQLAVLESSSPETLVHTGAEIFFDDGSRPPYVRKGGEAATGRCLQTVFETNPVCGASVMMRRLTILKLGNYDPQLRGTDDYGLSLIAATRCDFVYLPEPLYRMRRHAGNMTNRKANMTYFHWLAQDKFRRECPEEFARLSPETVRSYMIEPVLRTVHEAYWQRNSVGYRRLLNLAIQLAPQDAEIRRLWRRRWCPLQALRLWDVLRHPRRQLLREHRHDWSARQDPRAPRRPGGGSSARTGGMEKFCRFLSRALLDSGWRLTVALSGEDIYSDLAEQADARLDVRRVDWLDRTFAGDRDYFWTRIRERRRWFRQVRPDVAVFVQSSNTPFRASIVGAALAGIPIVTTHRTMPWPVETPPTSRHLFGLLPGLRLHHRKVLRKTWLTAALARAVVCNSHAVQAGYERLYAYAHRKTLVIPNAVELPSHGSDAPLPIGTPRASAPASPCTIGYVGRISREKRLDVLIQALARMKTTQRVRLLLHGQGPEQANLADLVHRLGLTERVIWAGPTTDIWSAYQQCDIVVLCSPRESSSNMILEAMAAAKATIVTRVGGLPELVDHGQAGIYLPPLDVDALAASLDYLADHEAFRRQIGIRARAQAATRHNPRRIADAWRNVLLAATGVRVKSTRDRADVENAPGFLCTGVMDGLPARQY